MSEAKAKSRALDEAPIQVRFKTPTHLDADMGGLEYFKLFWWRVIGRDCAALYELLWLSACTQRRGGAALTRREVLDALGLATFDEVRPLVQHLKAVGLAEATAEGLALVNPLPRLSDRMYDECLPPALQALHDRYADRLGIPRRAGGPGYVQPSLLADAVPSPPPAVARARATAPEATKLVEFFAKTRGERLKAPDFVVRDRGKNIKIANSMLRTYDYDECLAIIRAYLKDEYRARNCDSLAPVLRQADLFLQISQGKVADETRRARGKPSKIIEQEGGIRDFDNWSA